MSDDLERELEQTREHLAATVDALTAKAETGAKRGIRVGIPVAVAAIAAIVVVVLWRRRR